MKSGVVRLALLSVIEASGLAGCTSHVYGQEECAFPHTSCPSTAAANPARTAGLEWTVVSDTTSPRPVSVLFASIEKGPGATTSSRDSTTSAWVRVGGQDGQQGVYWFLVRCGPHDMAISTGESTAPMITFSPPLPGSWQFVALRAICSPSS
jgi:hypothetical protein